MTYKLVFECGMLMCWMQLLSLPYPPTLIDQGNSHCYKPSPLPTQLQPKNREESCGISGEYLLKALYFPKL